MKHELRTLACLTKFAPFLLGAGCSACLNAATVVDQSNTIGTFPSGYNVSVFEPLGQTFTARLEAINYASIVLGDFGDPASDEPAQLELHAGQDGALLAISDTVTVPAGSQPTAFTFNFATPQPLVPGNLYSLVIVAVNDDDLGVWAGDDNYPGGSVFDAYDVLAGDLNFAEGVTTSLVPDPAHVLWPGIALFSIVLRRPRRGDGVH